MMTDEKAMIEECGLCEMVYANGVYVYDVEEYECWIIIGITEEEKVLRYSVYNVFSEEEEDQKEFNTAKECLEKIEELKKIKNWIKEYRIIHKITIEEKIKL